MSKSFELGNYKITYSVTADNGIYLSDATDGKAYFYIAGNPGHVVEKEGADVIGTFKIGDLAWSTATESTTTYEVPADDVINSLAGYYQVTITAGGKVVLLQANATSATKASTNDVVTATAWIKITANQSGNNALSFVITDGQTAADGFTALGQSADAGKLIGQFAIRPVNATDGDDAYYNASGAPVGETANDITVSWNGIS